MGSAAHFKLFPGLVRTARPDCPCLGLDGALELLDSEPHRLILLLVTGPPPALPSLTVELRSPSYRPMQLLSSWGHKVQQKAFCPLSLIVLCSAKDSVAGRPATSEARQGSNGWSPRRLAPPSQPKGRGGPARGSILPWPWHRKRDQETIEPYQALDSGQILSTFLGNPTVKHRPLLKDL